jgi:penicillin-binding protein 1A
MVGGSGFIPNEREVNMALSPRQTGSSIKFLILAAAVQAGAQAGDVIDGVRGCTLPNAGDPNEPFFQINGGASGSITNLAEQTWSSINCAFARLSQIVGLNRIVDTVYRAAESPYLFRGQQDRAELLSVASFATGANELSPLDMAAGIQTVANEGVHKQPYYVDFITDAEGARTYTHFDPGTKVFDQDTALLAIDILKGVLRSGTARRHPLADGRAAFGKTGTQQDNTNAWFVGGTKQLSTAVWVGDPDAYTPMVGIDEFLARGVNKVQGGLFPAEIWKAFMDPAHTFLPQLDWDAPPAPERPNARLFLPGNECIVEVVGFEIVEPEVDPNAPPTTPPPADAPPAETVPPETIPIVEAIEVGTTISPDNLDPNSPLPTIEASASIGPCR